MQQKNLNSVLPGLALLRTGSPSSIEYTNMRKTSTFQASYFNHIVKLRNYVCKLAPPTSFSSPTAFQLFVHKFTSLTCRGCMKSITPARGHQSLRAHATRNLFQFLYDTFIFIFAARTMITTISWVVTFLLRTSNNSRRYAYEHHTVARKLVMTASLETSLHMRMLSQQHLRTGSLG